MARVLVVDDEADVVEFLTDIMEEAGWQTGSAYDGVEAVLKILDDRYDIVVMDIRMPKLDGINALRLMKRVQPNLPVILFTGQAGRGDMFEATRFGAYTCLLKPVVVDKLLDVVTQATKMKTSRQEGPAV